MIRSLLAGAIDYAGLFPPASLAMPDAARNYRDYRQGPDAWALGRFVVPVARLGELSAAGRELQDESDARSERWRLSVLLTGDGGDELPVVEQFNAQHTDVAGRRWTAVVDSIEARAEGVDAVEALVKNRRPHLETFVEVPADSDPAPLLAALAAHRLRGKFRTGGSSPAQFPSALQVARFLSETTRLRVPFKATAGLHHPLRAEYRLTYAADSDRGTMFGFLNVLLAAAAACAGAAVPELVQILEERDPAAFAFDSGAVSWRGRKLAAADVAAARTEAVLSFGSCSFDEPLADLRALGLL